MKHAILNLMKSGLVLTILIASTQFGQAANFTAIASGEWSSSATWGGTPPSTNITSDQITIPTGITVNLDNNTKLDGALSSLTVNGTLTSSANTSLTVDAGSVIGNGTIAVEELVLNSGATLTFLGSVAVNKLSSSVASLSVAADVVVNETMTLSSGAFSLASGGSLTLENNSDIVISGGTLSAGSGTLGLTNNYNVIYTSGSATAGVELSGSGLQDITVDVGNGNNVTLSSDLDVNGTLHLTGGSLVLSGNDLTVSGDVSSSGSGYISSTSSSNITINANGGLSGSLSFDGNGNTVNDFTINVGSSNSASISGMLTVEGTLGLTDGSLDFSDATLVIDGTVDGSGSLMGNGSSTLNIITSGGISSALHFASGSEMVGDFMINVGSGNSVTVVSDLSVHGTLDLNSGSDLDISGQSLTIGSSGDIMGSGSIIANGSSSIIINAGGGTTSNLSISGSSVGSLTVNTGSGNSVSLAGDVNVSGNLSLQGGSLDLNNNDLTISGDIASGGSGNISSSGSSNIWITGNSSTSGSLSFSGSGNTVGNLTVDLGSGNSVALGSDLMVNGTLDLNGGSDLDISGQTLTIGSSGDISGSGSLMVDGSSNLVVNANGGTTSDISLSGSSMGSFTIDAGNGNSVNLGSDANVSGDLNLQSGMLDLNGNNLIISGDISAGGSGTITSSSSSNISISGSASTTGSLNFSSGGNTVGDFTVDITNNGSVSVGSDMMVDGALTFDNGSVNIGSNQLTISASGSISGAGNDSYIITSAGGSLAIDVSSGGGSVNFPVGTSSNFSPANITLNSGNGTVMVGAMTDVYAQGTSGTDLSTTQPVVDATWNIESSISSNLDMDIELMWSSGMEVNGFDNSAVYISHYTNGNWDATATASATAEGNGMFSIQRNNITSLSPFAVFDQNTVTGIAPTVVNDNMEVYPNPVVNNMFLTNIDNTPVSVDVMNMTGQVVKTFSVNNSTATLSLDDLSTGSYFVRIYNDNMSEMRKVVKR